METPAPTHPSLFQFRREQGSVPLLMGDEVLDFIDDRWRAPSRHPALGPINANGAMLSGVIDLKHHFADGFRGSQATLTHA